MASWTQIAMLREQNRDAEAERLRRIEQSSAEQLDESQFQVAIDIEPSPLPGAVPSASERKAAPAVPLAPLPASAPAVPVWVTASPFRRQSTTTDRAPREVLADEIKAKDSDKPLSTKPKAPIAAFTSGRDAWKERADDWERVRMESTGTTLTMKVGDGYTTDNAEIIQAIHAFLEGLIGVFDVKSVASVMHDDLLKFGRRQLLNFLRQREDGDWRTLVAPRYHQAIESALADVRDKNFALVFVKYRQWTDTELLLQPAVGAAIRKLILYHWETVKKEKSGAYQQKRAAETLDETWQTGMTQLIDLPRTAFDSPVFR